MNLGGGILLTTSQITKLANNGESVVADANSRRELTIEQFENEYLIPHYKWKRSNNGLLSLYEDRGKQLVIKNCDLSKIESLQRGGYEDCVFINVKFPKNCRGIHINNSQFLNCDFENTVFYKAQLSNSDFSGSNFSGSSLDNVILKQCKFDNVKLSASTVGNVVLNEILRQRNENSNKQQQHAQILTSHSSMKKLTVNELSVKLEKHSLWLRSKTYHERLGEQLDLSDCDLSDFSELNGNNFTKAICRNTIFPRNNFHGNNFTDADLQGAILSGSDLKATNFCGSNLQDANVNDSDISQCTFSSTNTANLIFNKNTKCKFDLEQNVKLWTKSHGHFSKQKTKHVDSQSIAQTITNASTAESKDPMTTPAPANPAIPSFLKNTMANLATAAKKGVAQGAANQASKILTKGSKKLLRSIGVPRDVLETKLGTMMVSLVAPQLLLMLTPYIPQLKNEKLQLAIAAALQASIAQVVDNGIGKLLESFAPMIGPMFKQLLAVEIPAIEISESDKNEKHEPDRVVQVE